MHADLDRPWSVRPFRPGDEAQIASLYETVFGRPVTPAEYRWKFLDAPWRTAAPNVWVAEIEGRIVSHYGGSPARVRIDDRTLPALHGCDVMTHPEHRRRGIFASVEGRATEAWRQSGIALAYGLHHGSWAHRRHHLGWRDVLRLHWLRHPLDLRGALAGRVPAGLAPILAAPFRVWTRMLAGRTRRAVRNAQVEAVGEPGDAFDALWLRLADASPAQVVRDRAWVRHRYAESPCHRYRLFLARRHDEPVGYASFRVDGERATLADLFTSPSDGEARAALLLEGLHELADRGVHLVRALVPRGPLRRSLLTVGFLPARGGFDATVAWLGDSPAPRALRHPGGWFTTAGDYDVA